MANNEQIGQKKKGFMQRKISPWWLLIGFVILAVIGKAIDVKSDVPQQNPVDENNQIVTSDLYVNTEKGFSAKFPSVAKVTESADGSVYGDIDYPHQARIMVSTFGNSASISKDKLIPDNSVITDVTTLEEKTTELVKQSEDVLGSKANVIQSRQVDLLGVPAYFIELQSVPLNIQSRSYALLKNGRFYEIAIIYAIEDKKSIEPLFDSFVSSFRTQ